MNDLISRQVAVDAVHKNYDTILDFKSDGRTVADSFEDIINALPPAQPETATVTRGRTKGETILWYECDACGETVDENDNYCSNCGRKLKHE